jgi:ferric-dicitrate binding protein FerR (iron transport regulator)
MVESDQKIWAAISSVINGNSTTEEKELVDLWLNESIANRKFYKIVSESMADDLEATDDIKERIFASIESRVLPRKTNRRIKIWIPAAAAMAAILVLMAVFTIFGVRKTYNDVVLLESVTPYGVKTKILLSDSTIVYLNAGTSIKYPARFQGKTREVILKGEAYFEVSKDEKHPFVVRTNEISIKVLGTRFNLKSFPEEDLFETSLLEGSVALYYNNNEKEMVKLIPNQKASYKLTTGKVDVQKVNAELDASWKEGKFYFNNEYLPSILRALERNYNVPIKLCTKDLNDEVYSGLFNKNRTVYQTLDIMKLHKNFNYETKNDTIMIYLKNN